MRAADIDGIAKLKPEILPSILSRCAKLATRKHPNVREASKKGGNSLGVLFDIHLSTEGIGKDYRIFVLVFRLTVTR